MLLPPKQFSSPWGQYHCHWECMKSGNIKYQIHRRNLISNGNSDYTNFSIKKGWTQYGVNIPPKLKKKKMEWSSIWKDVGTHRKCYYLLQKLAFYAWTLQLLFHSFPSYKTLYLKMRKLGCSKHKWAAYGQTWREGPSFKLGQVCLPNPGPFH